MADTMETFQYTSLDRSKREIRLIELLPTTLSPDLRCTIFHASLDAKPRYVALSYTWGDPHDTQSIVMGNASVAVTRNLYSALAHLRYEADSRIFWIDALCINQQNDEEKGWQVQLMRDIYQCAEYVSVWLGPADGTSDAVMDYLNDFGERAMQCGLDLGPGFARNVKQRWLELVGTPPQLHTWASMATITVPGYVSERGDLSFTLNKLDNLYYSISGYHGTGHLPVREMEALFTRPWWSRIWVFQEISLGVKSQLICGTKKISRRRCAAALNAFLALRWVVSESPGGPRTSYSSLIATTLFEHRPSILLGAPYEFRTERWPLLALLRLTASDVNPRHGLGSPGSHSFNATDPRDKIYGLLGLVDQRDLEQLGLVPDYTQSCQELFVKVTALLLQQGHISQVLSLCHFPKIQTNLPSWVPDWSMPLSGGFQYHENDHITLLPTYNTSKDLPHRMGLIGRTLNVDGFIYDKVFGVSISREPPRSGRFVLDSGQKWLVIFMKLTSIRNSYYRSLTERVSAAARVATAGLLKKDSRTYIRSRDERFYHALSLLQLPLPDDYFRTILSKLGLERLGPFGKTNMLEFCAEMSPQALGRTPFVTRKGHLGLGSEYVRPGDSVAVFGGGDVPFLVREIGGGTFEFVGEAYVDGIMDGEAVARGQRPDHISLV